MRTTDGTAVDVRRYHGLCVQFVVAVDVLLRNCNEKGKDGIAGFGNAAVGVDCASNENVVQSVSVEGVGPARFWRTDHGRLLSEGWTICL